jgi:hypothetical protein
MHVPISEIYLNGAVPHLSSILVQQRLAMLGHGLRHDTVLRRVFLWTPKPPYRQRAGGQPWTFRRQVEKQCDVDASYVREYSQDRRFWRGQAFMHARNHEDAIYEVLDAAHSVRASDPSRIISLAWTMMAERDVFSHFLPSSIVSSSNAAWNLSPPRLAPRTNYFLKKEWRKPSKCRFDPPPLRMNSPFDHSEDRASEFIAVVGQRDLPRSQHDAHFPRVRSEMPLRDVHVLHEPECPTDYRFVTWAVWPRGVRTRRAQDAEHGAPASTEANGEPALTGAAPVKSTF